MDKAATSFYHEFSVTEDNHHQHLSLDKQPGGKNESFNDRRRISQLMSHHHHNHQQHQAAAAAAVMFPSMTMPWYHQLTQSNPIVSSNYYHQSHSTYEQQPPPSTSSNIHAFPSQISSPESQSQHISISETDKKPIIATSSNSSTLSTLCMTPSYNASNKEKEANNDKETIEHEDVLTNENNKVSAKDCFICLCEVNPKTDSWRTLHSDFTTTNLLKLSTLVSQITDRRVMEMNLRKTSWIICMKCFYLLDRVDELQEILKVRF